MRMRKKKHTDERIQACAEYIRWNDMFSGGVPLHLEIGCGKGDFICAMARQFPDINFIAVEKVTDVVVTALEKAKSLNLPNLRFVIADIKEFANYIEVDTVSAIYLNFSDPWPKRYQHKKRLTAQSFIDIYKKILKLKAKIILKTDDKELFNFSVKNLSANKFTIEYKTYDLHNSEFSDSNVQTEYERNFAEQNIPVCYLSAVLN